MQKESFWDAKGVVLDCKRSPFTMQKEPFWDAKGLLFAMTCSTADVSFKNMRDVMHRLYTSTEA